MYFQLPCPVPEMFRGACNDFVFDQTTGLVAVRTENYCIQFYSLFDDREISEVHRQLFVAHICHFPIFTCYAPF